MNENGKVFEQEKKKREGKKMREVNIEKINVILDYGLIKGGSENEVLLHASQTLGWSWNWNT
jgi:hypothetical protein